MNRETQAERNRAAFEGTGLLEVIDLFKKHFNAKVIGAVNLETGYAVGQQLELETPQRNPYPRST